MTITPKNGDLTAGIAGQYAEDIARDHDPIITGDLPAFGVTTDETAASGNDLEARTVVGFDANGKIVPADISDADPANHIVAVGVLAYAVDASAADAPAHVWRTGCLNPEMLVWPASYDTDAKKAKAFEGAPSPTQIIIRKIATLAV